MKVVFSKNEIHAALYLILVLIAAAAAYILLGAEFIAITQILIYVGAVLVLFLFAIMLANSRPSLNEVRFKAIPGLASILLFIFLSIASIQTWSNQTIPKQNPKQASSLAHSMFSTYLIPFELISVLLLAVLVGVIVLAKKQ